MRRDRWPVTTRLKPPGCRLLIGGLALLCCGACKLPMQTAASDPQPVSQPNDTPPAPTIPEANATFAQTGAATAETPHEPEERLIYELTVLHIQLPHERCDQARKVWNHLREDAFDAETGLRLQRNGLRVGVGHEDSWEPIKLAMDSIEDHRVITSAPLRMPVGYPLGLELDNVPRDQTLFCVGRDGILSGSTWPQSRNVLRITNTPDPHDPERVVMMLIPEVRQQDRGWKWVRTESGLWQVPQAETLEFDAAGIVLTLAPGEFVLLAPSENAEIAGLLGDAFLTVESAGVQYDSYVFIRPEAQRVGRYD